MKISKLMSRLLFLKLALLLLANTGFAQVSLLINANVASEYIVTSMPMKKSPDCPLIGSIRFFPGGNLTGTFVNDMARSRASRFTGNYVLKNGKDISFTSSSDEVPLANINGVIVRSVISDRKKPPIEYLILTTNTPKCLNEQYKLTLTQDEE